MTWTYASRDDLPDDLPDLRCQADGRFMISTDNAPSFECVECGSFVALLVGVSCIWDIDNLLVCAPCAHNLLNGMTHLRVHGDEADGTHEITINLPGGEVWRDGKPFLTPPAPPE